jgi:phage terminase large subunit-like protein
MTNNLPPNSCVPNWLDVLLDCARDGEEKKVIARLTERDIEFMLSDWLSWARPDQRPPDVSQTGLAWTVWLVLGGRGAGKTRTGAEWVRGMALGLKPFTDHPVGRIALIGETQADVRDVMIEGVSGLLAVHRRDERPQWQASRRRIEWPNGAIAQTFSAEEPDGLRGPQFGAAWLDELAKWRRADETFDMLQFGLRLGQNPRQTITTTPRPIPLLKRLMADPATALSRAATRSNAYHLAPSFLDAIVKRYAGTRLGRQELEGEWIDERGDGLWSRALLERCREDAAAVPPLQRLVLAIDPPASSGRLADRCGMIVAGLDGNKIVHVLADATMAQVRPHVWAARAAALYRDYQADAIVIEVNQGGEMVETVFREADPGLAIVSVRAMRGKMLRAEPVALLYEQQRVRHAGAYPELEDEMCDFGPHADGWGLSSGRSPDRLDALVWAVTALALGPKSTPRVRRL